MKLLKIKVGIDQWRNCEELCRIESSLSLITSNCFIYLKAVVVGFFCANDRQKEKNSKACHNGLAVV